MSSRECFPTFDRRTNRDERLAGDIWSAKMHKRLRGPGLILAALLIAACAGPARREHPIYWYDTAPPAGFPETVRTVTEDRVSFEKDSARFIRRVRLAAGGGVVNVLALSGGGAGA